MENVSLKEESRECTDVACKNPNHCCEVDAYIVEILDIVENASFEALPGTSNASSNPTKKKMPGWCDEVKPFRDTAFFWSQVWKSAGSPLNTELHKVMKRTRNIYHYQARKCKKAEDFIKRNKLLNACVNGSGDIFSEIKKLRSCRNVTATSMDGVKEDIPGHFKSIYSKLYNSADDKEELTDLMKTIDEKVNFTHLNDVNKVTTEVVKEAVNHLKDNKSDPIYSFSSDSLKNGPDILFDKLSVAIRCFLVHGHVTVFLLLATLLPIIKDKLARSDTSKNYRSIALSSLILKIIDWIILLLFGTTLGLDDLQFAYQPGASTTMCTWAVMETISYFMRNGSEVFACTMDMTKAFDLVKHSILFKKLLVKGLSVIFLRLLLFIYLMQFANVKWNGETSSWFSLGNGVRQGGVISAILYCFYVNDLFVLLRQRGEGCWIQGSYCGIYGYSDDNFLLAPSLHALQCMLDTCEEYAAKHNLRFSTDPDPVKCKTKCLAFTFKTRKLKNMMLCGDPLPWVENCKHLGNYIRNKIDGMKNDQRIKQAQYINKNNELEQEFHFCHPRTKFKINRIYNSHFTGSPLWDLFSPDAVKLESSWNRSVKIMYDLPYETHRCLIEPLSGTHIKRILINRFLNFLKQIINSKKNVTKVLLNTIKYSVKSTTGRNLRKIMLLTGKSNIEELNEIKIDELEYHPAKEEDRWKLSVIDECIDIKFGKLNIDGFNKEEIEDICSYLCKS